MAIEELRPIIANECALQSLDPQLIEAIVMTETGGNPWLTRFEPSWRYFTFVNEYASQLYVTAMTEKTLQAMSFGPMQIMGSVARELGFREELTKLTIPAVALHYSCLKIKNLFQKYGIESDVVSAYNQGSPLKTPGGMYVNQYYVDQVYSFLTEMRKI